MNDKSEIAETLRGFAGTLTKLRITRTTPCDSSADGFVLSSNNDWFLLWQFHDFYPYGFSLMRVDGVTNIRCGEYERHWTKILAEEGIAQALPNPNLTLADVHHMLSQLQSMDVNFIIECEDDDEDIEDFFIGRLINLDADTCKFANFDALGCWDDTLCKIALDEITRIQWDTPYANTFSRHLAGPCPFLKSEK